MGGRRSPRVGSLLARTRMRAAAEIRVLSYFYFGLSTACLKCAVLWKPVFLKISEMSEMSVLC